MSLPTLIQYLKFKDLLESLGLEHTHGHILDLTQKMENTIARPPRVCRYLSDRAAVHCEASTSTSLLSKNNNISYRKAKAVDMGCLKHDLAQT